MDTPPTVLQLNHTTSRKEKRSSEIKRREVEVEVEVEVEESKSRVAVVVVLGKEEVEEEV